MTCPKVLNKGRDFKTTSEIEYSDVLLFDCSTD